MGRGRNKLVSRGREFYYVSWKFITFLSIPNLETATFGEIEFRVMDKWTIHALSFI